LLKQKYVKNGRLVFVGINTFILFKILLVLCNDMYLQKYF